MRTKQLNPHETKQQIRETMSSGLKLLNQIFGIQNQN